MRLSVAIFFSLMFLLLLASVVLTVVEVTGKRWVGQWERLYFPGEIVAFEGRKVGWKMRDNQLVRRSDGAVFVRKCGVCVSLNRGGL